MPPIFFTRTQRIHLTQNPEGQRRVKTRISFRVRHTPCLLGASDVGLPRRVERETECLDVSFHEKGVVCDLRHGNFDGDHEDRL